MKQLLFTFLGFFLVHLNGMGKTIAQGPFILQYDSLYIHSEILKESRRINIWTPPAYVNGKDSLLVIYMPDGGIAEDFPHIAETLSELIATNAIPPVILVGIENTNRRRDLTGPSEVKEDSVLAPLSDGAAQFRAFVREELFPGINKRYRTSGKKGIIGESLAGLFVMETCLLQPDMFDHYIAMDPSVWWNNGYLVRTAKEHLASFPKAARTLWFAGSKDMVDYTRPLAETLKTQAVANLKWCYADEPEEDHGTIYKATKKKALIWTFRRK
ncbi:MAG: alpha/beta hydrolase [Sphingobacteriales bacterium]|nr:MAG: alpha/beta hydrolase [Sphingobacteriales bacterium]